MGKRGNSVIGLDLGKHVFKGVVLQRKGDTRYVLTSYASLEVPENLGSADDLAQQVKLLLKDLGGAGKPCAVAVSDPASLLRIIEQPDTPVDLLRNALRLNGLAVLNQECKDSSWIAHRCPPATRTVTAPTARTLLRMARTVSPKRNISSAGCCGPR